MHLRLLPAIKIVLHNKLSSWKGMASDAHSYDQANKLIHWLQQRDDVFDYFRHKILRVVKGRLLSWTTTAAASPTTMTTTTTMTMMRLSGVRLMRCLSTLRTGKKNFHEPNMNRPFPRWPLFQDEAWCTDFHINMKFYSFWNIPHFHLKGCAPDLNVLVRLKNYS